MSAFTCLKKLSWKQCIEYLVNGYVKKQFINKHNAKYAISLNKIIEKFLGNIFILFDVYNKMEQK